MTAVNQLPRIVILAALAVAHWSCGGSEPTGTTPPPPPDNTVASVSISGGTGVVIAGTLQLTATAATSSGSTVSTTFDWSSSNSSFATVNQSGLVTGVALGSVTITATASGTSISGTHSVTVTAPLPVSSVVVSPGSATLLEDFTQQLSADPRDANGNTVATATVSWTSSNGAVATVNSTGLVTGIVAGSATITATADAVPGTAQITVEVVTLTNHVQPIFSASCALAGCHTGASPQEGQNLSAGLAWSNTVNVASAQLPTMNRVTPGNPSQSYLVHKIEGTQLSVGGSGVQMPEGGPPLSSQNIAIIRSWITKGALDN